MSKQVEVPLSLTQALQEFRQEFAMGEYVEYTGKGMGAIQRVDGWRHITQVPKRGWIVAIRLDLWGQNMYRVHWEDMPDAAFASDEIHPDLLKPVVVEE